MNEILVVVRFILDEAQSHPLRYGFHVPTIILHVVGAGIAADDTLLKTFDVVGRETFTPQLNTALPPRMPPTPVLEPVMFASLMQFSIMMGLLPVVCAKAAIPPTRCFPLMTHDLSRMRLRTVVPPPRKPPKKP